MAYRKKTQGEFLATLISRKPEFGGDRLEWQVADDKRVNTIGAATNPKEFAIGDIFVVAWQLRGGRWMHTSIAAADFPPIGNNNNGE